MKTLLSTIICLLLFSQVKAQENSFFEDINFSDATFFVKDTVFYTTYYSTEKFTGDCTYELFIDSIRDNDYFISGKYDGNCKCLQKVAVDTIRLGNLPDGIYTIHYSLIDLWGHSPTETLDRNFTVSLSNVQLIEENQNFTVLNEGKGEIVFILRNKSNNRVLLHIYDINGKENNAYLMEKESLKISNLSHGIYLYRLENEDGVFKRGKFCVVK